MKKGTKKIETIALRIEVKEDKHPETYVRLMGAIGNKTNLQGPMDYSIKLKLGFRGGDLGLRERWKIHTSSRGGDNVDAHVFQSGTAIENRAHIVG